MVVLIVDEEALDAAVAEAIDHGVYLYAIQVTSMQATAYV
jgi:hypothetical protein